MRPATPAFPQDHHHKKSRTRMQQHIRKVIPEDRVSPELMLHPEGAVQQRVILLGRAYIKPDSPETMQRPERRFSHMRVVVPQNPPFREGQYASRIAPNINAAVPRSRLLAALDFRLGAGRGFAM